eukprot:scaffold1161_cov391-Prasinococcus_capsulatus_cf.AAC.2
MMPTVVTENMGGDGFIDFFAFKLQLFKWNPETTPLSSFTAPATAIVFYLGALVVIKLFVKERERMGLKPFVLRTPLLVHNMFLSGVSLFVLLLMVRADALPSCAFPALVPHRRL